YNLALGEPLHGMPIVRTALAITRLSRGHVRVDELGELLRSPFLRGGNTEATLRARFDAWLRRHQVVHVRIDELPGLFERFGGSVPHVPVESATHGLLNALPALCASPDKPLRASRWCERWQALLAAAGWPGDESLDSGLYQTTERFRSLIDEIAGLDFLTGRLQADAANSRLADLCKSIQFQPQTPDLSVQIMLPEQATGLQFDHVWWCGVYAGAFPAAASPNPFLPREWQHKHEMPGSSAQVELDRARRLSTRLLRAAGEVVVSIPRQVDDHPVSVAPLVEHLDEVTHEALNLHKDSADAPTASVALEAIGDARGPAVDLSSEVRGGTALLGLQATCPFRAFGELRLNASELEEPQPGLDARERGSLMHAMLERLWRRLQSSDMLMRLNLSDDSDEYVQLQLFELAEAVLDDLDRRRLQPLSPRFRSLEQQRLIQRALAWLRVETGRAPFTVIATEQSETVTLGDLSVRVAIDRIDQLENGAGAVIDYKTGRADVGDWFGDRPTQPQLPLYALAQSGAVDVIAYGLVHPAKPAFNGAGRDGNEAPGVRPLSKIRAARDEGLEWDDLVPYWRERLTRLAGQFAAGEAAVDPKNADACRYCSLPALCRINSVEGRIVDDDAGEEGGDV
ncbi:MAG: PD-(D/E)XK nuclease family protein, partial [Pseudomonadota bacterium]